MLALLLAGPMLVVALGVGLIISIVQAVTQSRSNALDRPKLVVRPSSRATFLVATPLTLQLLIKYHALSLPQSAVARELGRSARARPARARTATAYAAPRPRVGAAARGALLQRAQRADEGRTGLLLLFTLLLAPAAIARRARAGTLPALAVTPRASSPRRSWGLAIGLGAALLVGAVETAGDLMTTTIASRAPRCSIRWAGRCRPC
jgi:flagellar biosynthesis protein FliQ